MCETEERQQSVALCTMPGCFHCSLGTLAFSVRNSEGYPISDIQTELLSAPAIVTEIRLSSSVRAQSGPMRNRRNWFTRPWQIQRRMRNLAFATFTWCPFSQAQGLRLRAWGQGELAELSRPTHVWGNDRPGFQRWGLLPTPPALSLSCCWPEEEFANWNPWLRFAGASASPSHFELFGGPSCV